MTDGSSGSRLRSLPLTFLAVVMGSAGLAIAWASLTLATLAAISLFYRTLQEVGAKPICVPSP